MVTKTELIMEYTEKSASSFKMKMLERLSSRKCRVCLLFQSVSLTVSGLFCLLIFPLLFSNILQSKMTIKPGTVAYDAWKKPNIPTKIK